MTSSTISPNPGYILGKYWDVVVLTGLGSLALYPFMAFSPATFEAKTAFIGLMLSCICNFPHYAATYFRVYGSSTEMRSYPFSAVIAPLLLFAWLLLSINTGTVGWYCKAYLLAAGIHYSGQTYGLSLIVAGKNRVRLDQDEKVCIRLLLVAAWIFSIALLESTALHSKRLFAVTLPTLGLPDWTIYVCGALLAACLLAYLRLNRDLQQQGRSLPMLAHLLIGMHVFWFSVGAMSPNFWLFVPVFHCLQYLGFVTYWKWQAVRRNGRSTDSPSSAGTGCDLSLRDYIMSGRYLGYFGGLIAVGWFLFMGIPLIVGLTDIYPAAFAGALAASFFNMHHFILDANIWKLRKPDVRQYSGLA